MAVIRNQDNFTDPLQYIRDQLFILDYNNSSDKEILKMKIWVLDGLFLEEDGGILSDIDIQNPKNHFEWLLNELSFLDSYIKTTEGTLTDGELNFTELKQSRIDSMSNWVITINPSTGQYFKDYEMPYSNRPTLLSDLQFQELYQLFILKRTSGEWTTANNIIDLITTYCIDQESFQAEYMYLNYEDPADTYQKILDQASDNKEKNDYNYVLNMNEIYDEMMGIINFVYEDSTSFDEIYLVNTPQIRNQIALVAGSPTHKGIILAGGGYRFQWMDIFGNVISEPHPGMTISATDWLMGTVEWNFDYFKFVGYTTLTNTIEDFSPVCGKDRLPNGEDTSGSLTIERFEELNNRWKNINNLREDEITNIGTRVIIESMVNAVIPDLLPDRLQHFNDKKIQKTYYTNIIKEKRSEFS